MELLGVIKKASGNHCCPRTPTWDFAQPAGTSPRFFWNSSLQKSWPRWRLHGRVGWKTTAERSGNSCSPAKLIRFPRASIRTKRPKGRINWKKWEKQAVTRRRNQELHTFLEVFAIRLESREAGSPCAVDRCVGTAEGSIWLRLPLQMLLLKSGSLLNLYLALLMRKVVSNGITPLNCAKIL